MRSLTPSRVRVGTRGSRLAMAQAGIVVDALRSARKDIQVEVVVVKTLGDVMPPSGRNTVDGKSAFTGALEEALVEEKIDVAVHSMKDLPADLGDGLLLAAVPPRGDPRDVLVASSGFGVEKLPAGARIGTSSVRRRSQLLAIRRDLEVVEIHGNVETRIRRIREDGLDGVVLAAAGLQRIHLDREVSQYFDPNMMVPAACQGTIAVETRSADDELLGVLSLIEDSESRVCAEAERAFSRRLGGDCYVPLGAFASVEGRSMRAVGLLASPDGRRVAKAEESGTPEEGLALASRLADKVLESGGAEILGELRA